MVKRNADGTLKILGRMPDPDWINQLRDLEQEESDPEEESEDEDEPEFSQ